MKLPGLMLIPCLLWKQSPSFMSSSEWLRRLRTRRPEVKIQNPQSLSLIKSGISGTKQAQNSNLPDLIGVQNDFGF
jgi:hypothetical protein